MVNFPVREELQVETFGSHTRLLNQWCEATISGIMTELQFTLTHSSSDDGDQLLTVNH